MTQAELAAQGQLEAYNHKDLEGFLKWYSEDIMGYDIDTNTVTFAGKDEMRQRYAKTFSNKHLFCEIKQRMILGCTVVDYEHITFNEAKEAFDAIVIHHINQEGLIRCVRFSRGIVSPS